MGGSEMLLYCVLLHCVPNVESFTPVEIGSFLFVETFFVSFSS